MDLLKVGGVDRAHVPASNRAGKDRLENTEIGVADRPTKQHGSHEAMGEKDVRAVIFHKGRPDRLMW
ncbi:MULTISPECIES: hypothetical protein [unclassified Burkholderia]|nr:MULTISPECIES: hypothetical protein [unclassified Burkholderia]